MIPARVAMALQADGWYLRSDIIWSKPNPMPESVTDRPTKAHEYVFLLAKSQSYYFDADAVREKANTTEHHRRYHAKESGNSDYANKHGDAIRLVGGGGQTGLTAGNVPDGRNIRSVWHLATQPYAGAHFATMPEALVRRCVLTGSKAGDIILDPFAGSGTVGRVALTLGRRAICADLNPAYLALAEDRTTVTLGLPFVEGEATA